MPNSIANGSSENVLQTGSKCGISCRYLLASMGCLGMTIAYIIRVNLSVALVEMVNSTDTSSQSGQEIAQSKEFFWSEETQGVILSSFFYGYILTQLPGGWIASKFGGKHVFGCGILISSLLTLLTPLAADNGVGPFVAVRVLEGTALGVTFPAMNVLLSSWAPPHERSMMAAVVAIGCAAGTVVAQIGAGFLCDTNFLGGWPSVFYITGLIGICYYVCWLIIIFEKPSIHPRISQYEKNYILSSIGDSQDHSVKKHKVPWLAMLKSPPIHAINITYFCSGWAVYTYITALPSYYKDVLGLKILENGLISSIPYIVCVVFTILVAKLADYLITRCICTVGEVRKLATIGGLVIPACLMVASSYIGKDGELLGICLISISIVFGGCTSVGSSVNQLDIAPRFAGIVLGIGNIFCTLSGVISPLVTGWLTNDEPTRAQWQKVFFISASICVFGAVVFVIFGSGKEQTWNTPDDELLEEVHFDHENRDVHGTCNNSVNYS